MAASKLYYEKYLQNFKYKKNVKRVCIFHLILVGILSILILFVKNAGNRGGGGLLNGQNLLSMAEVICQQSLNQMCRIQNVYIIVKQTMNK